MKRNSKIARLAQIKAGIRGHRGFLAAALAASLVALVVISCGTFTGTVVAPPQIAGATFVGSASCEQCHQEIYRKFKTADHARLQAKGENARTSVASPATGPEASTIRAAGRRGR